MPDPDIANDPENSEVEPDQPTELELLQTRLDEQTALNSQMAEKLGNPDVAAVLQAQEEGKSLHLRIGSEAPAELAPERPSLDLDTLEQSSRTEMVESIFSVIKFDAEARDKKLLGAIDEKFIGINASLKTQKKDKIKDEAQRLLKIYPDLLEDKDAIVKLAGEGMTLEQAYAHHRLATGKGMPVPVKEPEPATVLETPTGATLTRLKDEKPARPGAQGFSLDTAEAAIEAFKELGIPLK